MAVPRGARAALVAAEAPDALAILSPSDTHESHLHAALGAGLDVLCDKPLVWGGSRLAARAAFSKPSISSTSERLSAKL